MENKCVLIIENGMIDRTRVSDLLHLDGYSVSYASDAKSALAIFNATRPFFILVSLLLLKVDSCTFSRIIKNDSETNSVKVVGFSEWEPCEEMKFYCGFDGIINVSETNGRFVETIREYIKKNK